MAKRVIDGVGIWRSKKLAEVCPAWWKYLFTPLYCQVHGNGVFECDQDSVFSTVFSYYHGEGDVGREQVAEILSEFERVGLLFRWKDQAGREWGFLTGSEKAGRLPPRSRLLAGHESLGPEPPAAELAQFISKHHGGRASDDGHGTTGVVTLPSNAERPQLNEAEDHPQSEDQSGAGVESGARSQSSKQGSRFPETFAVADEHRVLARELGVDVDKESARFADYWRAKPGRDGVKADWAATFRNWLRKAADFRSGKPVEARGGSSPKKRSAEPNYSDMAKTPDWAKD